MNTPVAAPAGTTIAYLTNVYPAVSHSFIKREILALEAQGFTIHRWSIRPFSSNLPDPEDRDEADKTMVLLASRIGVARSALKRMLVDPVGSARAIRDALRGRPAGWRAIVVRLAYFAEACALLERARALGVQHIHAHFGTNPTSVARLVRRLGGPGFSFTVHGPDEFDQPFVHDLQGKVASARFVVAISNFGRSQLMRWSDTRDWPKLRVVRCGLDRRFLDGDHTPIPDDAAPVLVCVARLAPQKGLPVLMEAAARLARDGHVFRLAVAGEGELRSDLERAIAREGLSDCVQLLGSVSAEAVRAEILKARAFVLPSFAEGLPVSIMEALALERPVISTRVAGIGELVDERCGRLVDAGDIDGLVRAMADLLACSAAELRALGRTGRDRVLSAHDARDNARRLAALIAEAGRA